MRKPEQRAWDKLSDPLKSLTPNVDRVEPSFGGGIPDIAYTAANGHGWIELKADEDCLSQDDKVDISHWTVQQRAWMRRRAAHGKNMWLVIATGHGWYAVPMPLGAMLVPKPTHQQLLDVKSYYIKGRPTLAWLRTFL